MIARLYAEKIQVIVPERSTNILFETTVKFQAEEFVVVLGHNGSGKSTLIKVLSGEIKPSFGRVLIDDTEMHNMPSSRRAQEIITLAQKADDRLFLDLTLEENIILWESRFPKQKQLSFEQIMALTIAPKRFLLLRKQQLRNLSGGEKQSILLSLALAHPPKILFLDEHTASLDPKASREIMAATNIAILDNKITTIMVTHNLEDALNYGNRLIIMNEGKLVVDQKKSTSLGKQELKEMMENIG
jgi:putative ABC transport system ATP-binding protein